MDLATFLSSIGRQRLAALALAVVTVVSSVIVYFGVNPTYTAATNVLVLPASVDLGLEDGSGDTVPVNPLNVSSSSSTALAAEIISLIASGPAFAQEVVNRESRASSYSVTSSGRSPILQVTAVSSDPQVAVSSAAAVVGVISAELASRQSQTPENQRIVSQPLYDPALISVSQDPIRSAIVVFAVGLILSAVAIVLLDRRKPKKTADVTGRGNHRSDVSENSPELQ